MTDAREILTQRAVERYRNTPPSKTPDLYYMEHGVDPEIGRATDEIWEDAPDYADPLTDGGFFDSLEIRVMDALGYADETTDEYGQLLAEVHEIFRAAVHDAVVSALTDIPRNLPA